MGRWKKLIVLVTVCGLMGCSNLPQSPAPLGVTPPSFTAALEETAQHVLHETTNVLELSQLSSTEI